MKYTRLLRRMRQRISDYPADKVEKAYRVLLAVKERAMIEQEPERRKAEQAMSERMLRLWA